MNSLEDLDTVIVHQGVGLPNIALDLEDSRGDDVDLTSGYDNFSAKLVDDDGVSEPVTLACVASATGFVVALPTAGLSLNEGEYLLQAECKRTSDGAPRRGYCRVQVLTGY